MTRWMPVAVLAVLAAALMTAGTALAGCRNGESTQEQTAAPANENTQTATEGTQETEVIEKITRTDEQWRARLTPEQYRIMRQAGTEMACSGAFYDNHEPGTYLCAGCDLPLFTSEAKFDSGTGWPSYFQPVAENHIIEREDRSHGMVRTEVLCARCDSHLGHVFRDGPAPTGLRYCINSVALQFIPNPEGTDTTTQPT